jgi:hypothetical protein
MLHVFSTNRIKHVARIFYKSNQTCGTKTENDESYGTKGVLVGVFSSWDEKF